MKSYICSLCKQDMRTKPHPGINGKDCPQCGQGISWKKARKQKESVAKRISKRNKKGIV